MKLLFDCTELSYLYDNDTHRAGIFNVALNLFYEFEKRNVDITFYCDYRRLQFIKKIKEFDNIPILNEHSFLNNLWGRIFYYTNSFPTALKYIILILSRFYDALFYRINKKNLGQLQEFDCYFSPFTPPSMEIQEADFKRFRMIHDVIPILEQGFAKSPKDWHYKVYNTINDKDFYLANSECTRKDVLKYFPFIKEENIKTTYLGVNEKFELSEKENSDKYIFSLCSLGKRKNLIFAIRNFFKFIEKNNIEDLKLVLGGSVWKKFRRELENSIQNFDTSKLVFTGYIKDKELPKWYSNAFIFVYPSMYEGFGLPVLEAMKCGCPVMTSNVSSLPEIIGNSGITIDPTNDEDMVKAFEKMYYDKFFRELCIERGLIRAEKFSWEKCADEILGFINSKLNQPNI